MHAPYEKKSESMYNFTSFPSDLMLDFKIKKTDIYYDLYLAKLRGFLQESMNDRESTTELLSERFNQHRIFPNTGTAILSNTSNKQGLVDRERMIAIIRSCYFESGIWSAADEFFEQLKELSGEIEAPLKILSDIVNHNLSDDHILEGVLHILSNYDYEDIDPYGITISLACAVNHSPVIQDLLISCFEKWESVESIDILKSLELEEYWLKEYRDNVIAQLKCKQESA